MPRTRYLELDPVVHEQATGDARETLDKAKGQVGFIPNMYANMVNQPALLDIYLSGSAKFREKGGFTPPEQELVFLSISHANHCEYCVSAHSMLAAVKSGLAPEVIAAVREGTDIPDARMAALDRFVRLMVTQRGNATRKDVERFLDAGFSEQHVLSIILAISVKVLSNYANHAFNTPLDAAFAEFAWE
jgi:uncharacterized peroxidase-related enzyme